MLISSLSIIEEAGAMQGEADVYIINLSGVPGSWVDNPSRVKDGAIDALVLKGKYIEGNVPLAHPKKNVDYPPYYDVIHCVVTGWGQYKGIIENARGVIVVNTHGEYLPVPSGYTREQWVDKIADAMLNRRLTWVHVGGYTFYRVWHQQSGTGEEWGAVGFQRFMNHINKGSVDLSPSPYSENEWATMSLGDSQQIALSWFFNESDIKKGPITEYHYATLGRPLKISDFREYLILPIFQYGEFLTGAVISFAKAGTRYTGEYGVGAYVHLGARYLYDIDGIPFDADFGRGFIGTAAALWVESQGFSPSFDDAVEGSYWGPESRKAGMKVHPSVSGVYRIGLERRVRMEFAIYGLLQTHTGDDAFVPDHVVFTVLNLPAPDWSDVQMKTDLDLSREASGEALQLQGLYPANEIEAKLGIAPSAITWFLGYAAPYKYPILTEILLVVGGFKLLGQWLQQGIGTPYSGVNTFASWTGFDYMPRWRCTSVGDQNIIEYNSIITVEFEIPIGTRSGWLKMPITYEVGAVTQILACPLTVQNTFELAVWFGSGGQEDAGILGDAGDSYESARAVDFQGDYVNDFHAYLGGGDYQDWYIVNLEANNTIRISMTSRPYANFDLELYSPTDSTTPWDASHQGMGQTDVITHELSVSGEWRIRVYKVQKSESVN